MLRSHRSLSLVLAAAALAAVPAAADAATKAVAYPTVASVLPHRVAVGQQLTIRGTNFVPGTGKTTVVFRADNGPAVFVPVDSATTTKIVVTVPDRLSSLIGTTPATQFRLRVLAKHFAKSWTRTSRSPLVVPKGGVAATPGASAGDGTGGGTAGSTDPVASCQAAALANPAGDEDKDNLSNGLEKSLGMDPCNPDTDGDGVADGYEYASAKELNGKALPYPGTKPWPNPLDSSDATNDFDGDGLTLTDEYRLWKYLGGQFNADGTLPYSSDGTQNSGGRQPVTTPAQQLLDLDGDGNLTDDERDGDGDGLSNMVEAHTTGTQAWWIGVYKTTEKPYLWRQFNDLDMANPDTDGDGVLDGADDQDNDGWTNFQEMQLTREGSGIRVQPYNPCLPDPYSLTCGRYAPLDPQKAWPPFDGSEPWWNGTSGATVPFTWPAVATTTDPTLAWNGHGGPQGPTGP